MGWGRVYIIYRWVSNIWANPPLQGWLNENGGATASASSLRWPHAFSVWGENFVVADTGNNRIMIGARIPRKNNQPCEVILGQKSFNVVELNDRVYWPSARSLSMPYGVATKEDWLLVAEPANSRLLGWQRVKNELYPPNLMGAIADALMGQFDFHSQGENRSFELPRRDSLGWLYGIQICGNTAVITDSGNNRILLWQWQVLFHSVTFL